MQIFSELKNRGVIQTISDPILERLFNSESLSFFTGYDPTAKSLQLGNLFMIMTMKRLQLAGHRPIILVGGATGLIGDPAGKVSERVLLDSATVIANAQAIQKQLEHFLEFNDSSNGAILVNNMDWFKDFSLIEYMRTIGKYFRIGDMLAKDSVQSRLASESGMSLTEFTYQTLQAYDFCYLNQKFGVSLQIGGSDQWGNITAGIDYTRKVSGQQVYGMVIPLVTDANGQKFGKSVAGSIYLDAELTSPYQLYQYLLNTDDAHVIQYLNYFTFLSLKAIQELEQKTIQTPAERWAQKILAESVTEFVHGQEGLAFAKRAAHVFFGGSLESVSAQELAALFKEVPSLQKSMHCLQEGIPILDFVSDQFLFKSKSDLRRAIQQQGVYLNNQVIPHAEYRVTQKDLLMGNMIVFRKGKKNYFLIRFE